MVLRRLQKKTLLLLQIFGYVLTLFVGVSLILLVVQLYADTVPLLRQETDVFRHNAAVVSKNVSVFKTMNKERIYISLQEEQTLRAQPFVKEVSRFNTATFKIRAFTEPRGNVPAFQTDLFFESVPDKYLDVKTDEWLWQSEDDFIPIIIPENYLNLYNFGFAESQGLPVLSKNTISQLQFTLLLIGNGKVGTFQSRIVGFSSKINSILVPDEFLSWANAEFGTPIADRTSRLLVEFNDPSDERILQYFNQHDYALNRDDLELSKLSFVFRSALLFLLFVAAIVVTLSVAFMLLSFNLIIQKNKEMLQNLYLIGYSYRRLAVFYGWVVSAATLVSVGVAVATVALLRQAYLQKFHMLFAFEVPANTIFWISGALVLALLLLYNLLLVRNIKKIVVPKK